ncbi:hypothetical protein LJE86_17905 [bacterium BMS3Abin03]|nr:hypothetical protein [bacterium BMS3Abin03]MCG6960644.1 hypothetical protein [bacterium BMS3Abin03]
MELKASDIIQIPEQFSNKIGSGDLVKDISEKLFLRNTNRTNKLFDEKTKVVLYLKDYPSTKQLDTFRSMGQNVILIPGHLLFLIILMVLY